MTLTLWSWFGIGPVIKSLVAFGLVAGVQFVITSLISDQIAQSPLSGITIANHIYCILGYK